MKELTVSEFEAKLAALPTVEPDALDMKMLAGIDAETDNNTTPFELSDKRNTCSGKISLRVPKELHYTLLKNAKENGVSLNQFIVYKLAKQ